MKVVLDTNILISALIFGGKPRTIFELIILEKKLTGFTSKSVLNELLSVLKIKFKYSDNQLEKIEKLIEENFNIIYPQSVPEIIKEDSFDNQILAIAGENPVDFIISGDNHLLKVKNYNNIPIVTPQYFVDKVLGTSNN